MVKYTNKQHGNFISGDKPQGKKTHCKYCIVGAIEDIGEGSFFFHFLILETCLILETIYNCISAV